MIGNNITVIIPTLNEEENIKKLCLRIIEILPDVVILVVDDGSKDQTQNIIKKWKNDKIELLDRSKEDIHGLTISIKEGIQNTKTKFFMVIDGDFQHPPESLLDAEKCFQKNPDIVVGYRVHVEHWPLQRKIISFGAQFLGRLSLFIRHKRIPKDIMSGFFGGNKEYIVPFLTNKNLALKGYKLLFDLLKHLPRDCNICQFGYVFRNREFGNSKIGKSQIWEFFKSIF